MAALDLVEPEEVVLRAGWIATLAGLLLAGVSVADADSLALVGGRLIDGFGGPPLDDAVVLISGERISAVGRQGTIEVPRDAKVIDTRGKSVLPGLWEAHGHLFHVGEADPGAFQAKFADQLVPIMEAVARVTVEAGVTTLRDFCTACTAQTGLLEDQQKLRRRILAGEIPGPRLYFSGPALAPGTTVAEARAATRKLVEAGVDNIFVGSHVWPEPLLAAIVDIARENKLGVDAEARHVAALRVLLDAGVDRVHVFFTADVLADYGDEEQRALVRNAAWILCTLPMRQAYVTAQRFPGLVDHARFREMFSPEVYRHLQEGWRAQQSIAWGVGAQERVTVVQQKLREFIAAGGREQLVAATDAGAPLNFHSPIPLQLRNLVAAGLTPMEAIQSATLRAAQMQGVADQVGTVTAGKLADVIVVDGDPLQQIEVLQHRVERVIQNGRVVK